MKKMTTSMFAVLVGVGGIIDVYVDTRLFCLQARACVRVVRKDGSNTHGCTHDV